MAELTINSGFTLVWNAVTKKIIYSGNATGKLWTNEQVFQAATQAEIDAKIESEALTPQS